MFSEIASQVSADRLVQATDVREPPASRPMQAVVLNQLNRRNYSR